MQIRGAGERREGLAAVFEVAEGVEGRAGGGEQDGVAGFGDGAGAVDRRGEVRDLLDGQAGQPAPVAALPPLVPLSRSGNPAAAEPLPAEVRGACS